MGASLTGITVEDDAIAIAATLARTTERDLPHSLGCIVLFLRSLSKATIEAGTAAKAAHMCGECIVTRWDRVLPLLNILRDLESCGLISREPEDCGIKCCDDIHLDTATSPIYRINVISATLKRMATSAKRRRAGSLGGLAKSSRDKLRGVAESSESAISSGPTIIIRPDGDENPSKSLANSSKTLENTSKTLAKVSKSLANPSKTLAKPSKNSDEPHTLYRARAVCDTSMLQTTPIEPNSSSFADIEVPPRKAPPKTSAGDGGDGASPTPKTRKPKPKPPKTEQESAQLSENRAEWPAMPEISTGDAERYPNTEKENRNELVEKNPPTFSSLSAHHDVVAAWHNAWLESRTGIKYVWLPQDFKAASRLAKDSDAATVYIRAKLALDVNRNSFPTVASLHELERFYNHFTSKNQVSASRRGNYIAGSEEPSDFTNVPLGELSWK